MRHQVSTNLPNATHKTTPLCLSNILLLLVTTTSQTRLSPVLAFFLFFLFFLFPLLFLAVDLAHSNRERKGEHLKGDMVHPPTNMPPQADRAPRHEGTRGALCDVPPACV